MRIRHFTQFAAKLRRYDVQIPDAEFVASYVYGILAVCLVLGLFGTIKTLITFQSILKKTASPSVGQITKPKSTQLSFETILSRNIFNIDGTIPDSFSQHQMACPAASTKSSLSYRVIGIIFGGTAQGSVVLLEGNDKKSSVYKLNDTLPGGGKVTNITADKVFISNNSCPEYLAMEYPSPQSTRVARSKGSSNVAYSENGFERTGTSTQVTKPWVENILKNKLSSTLQDARAIPNLVNGQIKGFAITQIVPDSVYAKLGLQDGDVVSSINGIELNDAGRAIQTLNSLRNETHIELQVLRNGQTTQFSVNIQ